MVSSALVLLLGAAVAGTSPATGPASPVPSPAAPTVPSSAAPTVPSSAAPLAAPAPAAPAPTSASRVWLEGDLGGSLGAPAVADGVPWGAGVSGGVGVALGRGPRPVGLVGRVRELGVGPSPTHLAAIGFLARWPARPGPYVQGGLAHVHATAADDALARPVATLLAFDGAIVHGTGAEIGAGAELAPLYPEPGPLSRFRPRAGLSAFVLASGQAWAVLELGVRLDVGKRGT